MTNHYTDVCESTVAELRAKNDILRQQLAERDAEIECIQKQVEDLRQQLAAKQAEVDVLMLEYCPSEMSQEQLDNWAAHQRPAKEQ